MFNFFKKLLSNNDSETVHEVNLTDSSDNELIDMNELQDQISKKIRQSRYFNNLINLLSSNDVDLESIESVLSDIKSLIPDNYEVTLRIVRWDGKIIAQKGTVISPNVIDILFDAALVEFSLQIVLTPRPAINERYRILWFGLDYAGKTSLIHRLRYNEFKSHNRTVGQDIEDFIMDGIRITNVDLGGQKSLRSHWNRFPLKPHVIVYVIDASDENRFDEAIHELQDKILNYEPYQGVPILFLLNKADLLEFSKVPALVANDLNLPSVMDTRTWHVLVVSAKTGDGMTDIIEKLSSMIQSQVTK